MANVTIQPADDRHNTYVCASVWSNDGGFCRLASSIGSEFTAARAFREHRVRLQERDANAGKLVLGSAYNLIDPTDRFEL